MRAPGQFVPLTPAVFHILLALAAGERHGYAIMQDVERTSNGRVNMGPGTLYGSIRRMLEAGLIEETESRPDPEIDDERRRYYKLTALGKKVARAEAVRLEQLVRMARATELLPERR